jgi:hypothetical protein
MKRYIFTAGNTNGRQEYKGRRENREKVGIQREVGNTEKVGIQKEGGNTERRWEYREKMEILEEGENTDRRLECTEG